jgi:putative transcriptional regulator
MGAKAHFGVKAMRLLRIVSALTVMTVTVAGSRWAPLVQAQEQREPPHLAAGKILVARRSLADPNFAETVIVLVRYDDEGTVGLIVNRQTKVPLSRLSRDLEGAKGRSEPLYMGGPVATSGIMALIRASAKPDDAKHVSGDVYIISSKATLEKAMAAKIDSRTFRLYLGYAGWDAGQLEWEMGMDAWDVLPANAGIVFDPHPETIWSRLVEQEDMRMASARTKHLALWQ